MKKYLIAIVAVLTFASCSNILDLTPTTSVTEDAVWKDAVLINAYHTELYNAIEHGFRNWNEWQAKAIDEVYPAVNWGPCSFQHGTLSPDNVDRALYYWEPGYEYLRKINIFLDQIGKVDVIVPDTERLIAEAKFLKAWIYFVLTTRFGSCVLLDEYYSLADAPNMRFTRSSFDECVAEIERLIGEAMPILPKTYTNTNSNFGRATQDVCKAMLSRMYLYFASPLYNPTNDRAKWQKAADAALDFMNTTVGIYELYPSYRECFIQLSGTENREYIFGRNFTKTNGHNAPMDNLGRRFEAYGGWNGAGGPSLNLVADYEMQATGLPAYNWVGGELVPNLASGFDPNNPYAGRDPRMDGTIIHDGTVYRGFTHEMWVADDDETWGWDSYRQSGDNPRSHHILKKFMPDIEQQAVVSWQETCIVPWPIFRLAEIYMNYAEAMFELGDEATCREYLNRVRARAEMPPIPETETGEALRARIHNERRVEFAFEEHRFIDVRRWKIAEVTENRPLYGMDIIMNVATREKTYRPVVLLDKTGIFKPEMYLLPIRRNEYNKNEGQLQQTPGWESYHVND
jgi:hypothetical protein